MTEKILHITACFHYVYYYAILGLNLNALRTPRKWNKGVSCVAWCNSSSLTTCSWIGCRFVQRASGFYICLLNDALTSILLVTYFACYLTFFFAIVFGIWLYTSYSLTFSLERNVRELNSLKYLRWRAYCCTRSLSVDDSTHNITLAVRHKSTALLRNNSKQ